MDRRDFLKALVAIPAVASLPNPTAAAEELLEGIMYVSQSYVDGNGLAFTETYRKAGGKIWRMLTSETEIISLTEEPYCPWIAIPRWDDNPLQIPA